MAYNLALQQMGHFGACHGILIYACSILCIHTFNFITFDEKEAPKQDLIPLSKTEVFLYQYLKEYYNLLKTACNLLADTYAYKWFEFGKLIDKKSLYHRVIYGLSKFNKASQTAKMVSSDRRNSLELIISMYLNQKVI